MKKKIVAVLLAACLALAPSLSSADELMDITRAAGYTEATEAYRPKSTLFTSSYSAATVTLGEFKSLFSQLTLPALECPDALAGKTCTKIVVTCDEHPLSYADGATVNLATGEISGTPLNSVTYNIPDGLVVNAGFPAFGLPASLETAYMMVAVPFEEGMNYTYKFTLTIGGQEYTTSGKPKTGFWSTDNNLNMKDIAGIE